MKAGQPLWIEGPYGCLDGRGHPSRHQVWVAGGVGITPFLAMLEDRQPGMNTMGLQSATLHYCTSNADADPVLPRLRMLCERAQPPVQLQVHDSAHGQRLQPDDLAVHGAPMDLWFCGPEGLGQALRRKPAHQRAWYMHQEAFQLR